jgi:hypothetical protein
MMKCLLDLLTPPPVTNLEVRSLARRRFQNDGIARERPALQNEIARRSDEMQFGCRERRGSPPFLDDSLVLVRKRTVVVHERVLAEAAGCLSQSKTPPRRCPAVTDCEPIHTAPPARSLERTPRFEVVSCDKPIQFVASLRVHLDRGPRGDSSPTRSAQRRE